MIGKVELADLLCHWCGKPRLRVGLAPWGVKVVVCNSCKSMRPFDRAEQMALTAVEYQAQQEAALPAPPPETPPHVLSDGTTVPAADIGLAPDGIVIGKDELDDARRGRAGKGKTRA